MIAVERLKFKALWNKMRSCVRLSSVRSCGSSRGFFPFLLMGQK